MIGFDCEKWISMYDAQPIKGKFVFDNLMGLLQTVPHQKSLHLKRADCIVSFFTSCHVDKYTFNAFVNQTKHTIHYCVNNNDFRLLETYMTYFFNKPTPIKPQDFLSVRKTNKMSNNFIIREIFKYSKERFTSYSTLKPLIFRYSTKESEVEKLLIEEWFHAIIKTSEFPTGIKNVFVSLKLEMQTQKEILERFLPEDISKYILEFRFKYLSMFS